MPFAKQKSAIAKIRRERQAVGEDLNIGRGREVRALFSFGAQVEIAFVGRQIRFRDGRAWAGRAVRRSSP